MKKTLLFVLVAVLLIAAAVVPAYAATKADLLAEAAKSPVYHYVKVAVENAEKSVEITDAQADQIMPYVKHIVATLDKDNGPSVGDGKTASYSQATSAAVFADMDAICAILNYSYKLVPSQKPQHKDDSVLVVYNAQGKTILEYDGDVVAGTDAALNNNTVVAAFVGVTALVSGLAMLVVARRKLVRE